ncbi:hypothetical protein ADN00_01275 [Ornatilinea apprima]|uniref:DUF3854 domain-containing protein n=1 Tax=Ornatilinea apprima TaxID=1134406 RepID=A0A0P6XKT3_9CHLR|nr:DUF3854 domain-containing protein [Ornatilinea apprima]KPL80848.1 hypothetical protein ADN00_01275 [Ornatilinea apprima]
MSLNDLSLSEKHLKMLVEESGISDQVIRGRGYRTITIEGDLVQYGFSMAQRRVPGLLIPLHTTDGKIGLHVYRPDNPRIYEDRSKRDSDGLRPVKVLKYEIPKGTGVRVDCPPACLSGLKNPAMPLYITEGQKKGDALASVGATAVCLLGVWNFKGRNEFGATTILADFDFIAWENRSVRIVFDSDVMYKPSVRQAMERLTEILQRKGATVSAIYLPNHSSGAKWGVDDWLASGHDLKDLEALAELPRPIPQAALPTIELLDEPSPNITRPLCLVGKHAYAATWLPVRTTRREGLDKEGNLVAHNPPLVEEKLCLFIVRNDGQVFGEISDGQSTRPLNDLGLNTVFHEIVPLEKRWSTRGVRAYVQGQRPNPIETFSKIVDVINRFLDFDRSLGDQQSMAELIACYVMATYLLDAFNVIGFLWPNGGAGSGKTNLLIVVTEMAYLGQLILAGGSFASLRDLADYGATLAFDDAENLADPKKTDPDKRALLLAGNRRGSTVPLKEPDGPGKWKLRHVNAYSPRLFSGINIPDSVLATRTIVIPLIRTADRDKANYDPLDYALWPHDRRILVDELWSVGLANMSVLHNFEILVAQKARLRGRNLQPWKAILSIAAWLDSLDHQHRLLRSSMVRSQGQEQVVISGLWQRLEEISWHYQQEETAEQQSGDIVLLVLQGLCKLASDKSDIKDNSDIHSAAWTFTTSQITEAAQQVAEQIEADIDPEKITSRKVGRLLGKLRLRKAREGGKGTRMWQVTLSDLKRWAAVYNIQLPTGIIQDNNVTHVTDGQMSQEAEAPWSTCEIAIRLPADSKLPTIGGCWRRLSDGRIEAGYSPELLAMVLSIFLDKDVDAEKIGSSSISQLEERLAMVTGGEVIHIHLPEKSERSGDE